MFLPLDATHSADYAVARCPSVCPSVCLSVCHTPVLCQIKTATYIFKLFFTISSHTFRVYPYQTAWQYSDEAPPHTPLHTMPPLGGPITGASNARGYAKITILDQCLTLYQKPYDAPVRGAHNGGVLFNVELFNVE